MLFAFAYLLLRRVVRLFARSSYDLNSDLELVVLRHQLMVLRPQLGRRIFVTATGCSWPR